MRINLASLEDVTEKCYLDHLSMHACSTFNRIDRINDKQFSPAPKQSCWQFSISGVDTLFQSERQCLSKCIRVNLDF